MGELNFTLEEIVDFLCDKEGMKSHQILKYVYTQLKKHPQGKEEYIDGTFPTFKITGPLKRIKSIHITKKFNNLLKEYICDHELQWGEVLYIVYGYLMIHRPDPKLKSFVYES